DWRDFGNLQNLGMHEQYLASYADAVASMKIPAKGFAGVGAESVAIELDAPRELFAKGFAAPNVRQRICFEGEMDRSFDGSVLKFTRPLKEYWNYDWGHRPFDASLLKEPRELSLEDGRKAYVYIQEKCRRMSLCEEDPDVLDFLDQIRFYP